MLDLIGAPTRVKFQGDEKASVLKTPFPNEIFAMGVYMPILMDRVTVNEDPTIPGRININQASRVVLAGIPGMDEEIINQIISLRDAEPDLEKPNRRHETWLLDRSGRVARARCGPLMPFVTGRRRRLSHAGGRLFRRGAGGLEPGGGDYRCYQPPCPA